MKKICWNLSQRPKKENDFYLYLIDFDVVLFKNGWFTLYHWALIEVTENIVWVLMKRFPLFSKIFFLPIKRSMLDRDFFVWTVKLSSTPLVLASCVDFTHLVSLPDKLWNFFLWTTKQTKKWSCFLPFIEFGLNWTVFKRVLRWRVTRVTLQRGRCTLPQWTDRLRTF